MSVELVALLAGLGCAVAGGFVPALIARIPEPEAEPGPEPGPEADAEEHPEDEDQAKELYTAIAARRGLRVTTVLTSGAVGALIGLAVGAAWPLLFLLPLVPVGVALAVVDWRTKLLPVWLIAPTYVGLVAAVLVCFAVTRDTDDLLRALWGWLIAGGVFFVLWFIHPRGLGYGDVRLSGILGIALGYLGWGPLVVGVYSGFLIGGVGGGLLVLLRISRQRAIPFGPSMLLGALVGIVAGPALWAHLVTG